MDRLAEQVVAWHNSHPLAKRISIYDVHTIGVVALPFMRSGGPGVPGAGPRGPIEPVLTDAVSTESLAAWGTEESTIAANTNAAHLDALADQEEPPASAPKPGLLQRLRALVGRKPADGAKPESWAAFSERFVENLSARQVARFAQQHGYSVRPGDATWPHRVVPIDDQMMSRDGVVGGAWPFEIYVMSAAVDAGRSRSRILAGRSAGAALPPIIGRRCLDAKRVGLAALIPLCVMSAAGAAFMHRSGGHEETSTMAAAASAASAPALAGSSSAGTALASAAASAVAAPPSEAVSAVAHAAEPAASAAVASAAASSASSSPAMAEAASSAPPVVPDIRPHFVESARPPGYKAPPLQAEVAAAPLSSKPASAPALKVAARSKSEEPSAAASSSGGKGAPATPSRAVAEGPVLPITSVKPDVQQAAAKGTPVVALVAPPMRNKAEAEATLARMRDLVKPLQPDPTLMQAQLFESPEGWRPAVWPFASRIEAQLVNATLVARGLHTKAVDF